MLLRNKKCLQTAKSKKWQLSRFISSNFYYCLEGSFGKTQEAGSSVIARWAGCAGSVTLNKYQECKQTPLTYICKPKTEQTSTIHILRCLQYSWQSHADAGNPHYILLFLAPALSCDTDLVHVCLLLGTGLFLFCVWLTSQLSHPLLHLSSLSTLKVPYRVVLLSNVNLMRVWRRG